MPITRYKAPAYTVAELLVSMAIMAMLLTAAAIGIHAAHQSYAYNAQKTDVLSRARGVLDRIARDVRRADTADVPNDRSIEITLADGEVHAYEWDGTNGGNLTLSVDAGAAAILTGGVRDFDVSFNDPSYQVHIEVADGDVESETTMTTTPRKEFF